VREFVLTPEYGFSFELEGPGSNGFVFEPSGQNFYFQKVPVTLKELKIKVTSADLRSENAISVGTVMLRRVTAADLGP
jgi:hypothetical protein